MLRAQVKAKDSLRRIRVEAMQLLLSKRKTRRSSTLRRLMILALFAGAGAAWLAKDSALLRYRTWKEGRALRQAKQFIEQKDPQKAQVALDVALAAVPGNPNAWRVAADILEQVGAPQAVRLRRGIMLRTPDSTEDRAALVMSALRFRDLNTANEALSEFTPAQAQLPVALRAALAYALATDNAPVADALYDRLKPLYPQNEDLKVAHALLRLRIPNAARSAEARRELEVSAKNPKYAQQIHREFMNLALQQRDMDAAKRWVALLVAASGAAFADHLQRANLELLVDHRPFAAVMAELQAKVPATASDTVQFARWLMVQNKSADAKRWLGERPAALRNAPEVAAVRAEVLADLKEWEGLTPLLEAGAWGPVPNDLIGLVVSARVVGARGNVALRRQIWDEALRSAGTSLPALRVLQRLSGYWQWEEEGERTLWVIARTFPDQRWAHQGLFNVFRLRKQTEAMRSVMGVLRDADGSVLRYQSDWALLSLLLESNTSWSAPKSVLENLYRQQPQNAFFATGYAFALAQSERGAEALAVVEKMPLELREYPPRAPYLAYVYAVNRRSVEVAKFGKIAENGDWLPEESRLLTLSREIVTRSPVKAAPAKVPSAKAAPAKAPPARAGAPKP